MSYKKQILLALIVTAVTLTLVPVASAQPLTLGTWTIVGNGSFSTLVITAVDGAGNLSGTVYGVPLVGFYDSDARKITFIRNTTGQVNGMQVYTGYAFEIPGGVPGTTQHVLAGSFEAFQGTDGTAQRSVFAWVGLITTTP